MKVVIATDSFKGSLTSLEVAEAVCAAIRSTQPKVATKVLAISDGGEGFAETVTKAKGGKWIETDGHDALGLRGAGTRGALNQRLDNKVLFCTGQVLAVQNPFDPRRESHDFWTTGANGMKHGAESM